MSILTKEDYVNASIPLWAKNGSGGGAVNSVNAGYGISIAGTSLDPIIRNSGVLGTYSASITSPTVIKILNTTPTSILGTQTISVPLNQKTRIDIHYSIRVWNAVATTDNYIVDPVLNGVSIRNGSLSVPDYTTSGNGHYQTICGVVSGVIPSGITGSATFDIFMNNQNGNGNLYVYTTNMIATISAI